MVACCWAENGLDGERNKEAQMIELKKKTDAAVAAKTESETTLKNLQKTHSSMQKKFDDMQRSVKVREEEKQKKKWRWICENPRAK